MHIGNCWVKIQIRTDKGLIYKILPLAAFGSKVRTSYCPLFFFRFYFKGMRREKISTAVDFPLDDLDLNRYISGPKRRGKYNLYAVSVSDISGLTTSTCSMPIVQYLYR